VLVAGVDREVAERDDADETLVAVSRMSRRSWCCSILLAASRASSSSKQ